MVNDQLEYYIKNNLEPGHQNIEDIHVHYARRKKLYRQCGIPEIAFRNAEMLEVGPGGGYNALAFLHWNCKHIDLVEGNPLAVKDIQSLFKEQKIAKNKYDVFESTIEKYKTEKKYDIVIAEGILPFIYNQEEVIDILKELVNEKGIVVITCIDKIGFFIEIIKKLIGLILVRDIPSYDEKVKYLTNIFKPQLANLRGASKRPEDWVKETVLNPEVTNGMELTFSQAIQYFGKDFDVLNTSPQMFTDYSWNKDIWYNYKKDYLEQYDKKRFNLLMTTMPEIILPSDRAQILIKGFKDIDNAASECVQTLDISKIKSILEVMDFMDEILREDFEEGFMRVFGEIKEILSHIYNNESVNMEQYPHFFAAFGRAQQYISFVKK